MSDNCQECGTSLLGEPIPQASIDAGYYKPTTTHYRREFGHEIPGVYDGILYWSCPDCGFAWVREMHVESLTAASHDYVAAHNRARRRP